MDHELEPVDDAKSVLPFSDLDAPLPVNPAPPAAARWLAFAGILVGGLLGGAVGYGIGDVMGGFGADEASRDDSVWAAVGALLGGLTGAVGVGVVANLTLRAMNEWKSVQHPEGESGRSTAERKKADDKKWTRRPGT